MLSNSLPPVSREDLKRHVLFAMQRYWPTSNEVVVNLPIREILFPEAFGTLRLVFVLLPKWAIDSGVDGRLAVPSEACLNPIDPDWEEVDWWLASFLMLECWHERTWELEHGPIHSYSFRLKDWDARMWDYAWVNRIALFFRKWASYQAHIPEERLLGVMPQPEFVMTHDVDAVSKTLPIRIKQGCFNFFKALRELARGNFNGAYANTDKAVRFLFGRDDWWTLDSLLNRELNSNLKIFYHFFADPRKKTPMRWLFDPGYDVGSVRIKEFLQRLVNSGVEVGLHPSFDSWEDTAKISQQKKELEDVTGSPCNICRQHWLRFSWNKTWSAQEVAGMGKDTTLMFNDRSGFRNASALAWNPWQAKDGKAHQLTALPTVLMDSHFYDYRQVTSDELLKGMMHWVNECRIVSGQIAFLWHPHTMTKDYGWSKGFEGLISLLGKEVK